MSVTRKCDNDGTIRALGAYRTSVSPLALGFLLSKITVLVVEDEAIIRMDLVFFLIDEGFEVFEAGNADEAIALLETNDRIQIIVTDVDMPGSMDGLKLSAAVRNRWPPVKIIVMSGHRAARSPHPSLPYFGDRQQQLPLQGKLRNSEKETEGGNSIDHTITLRT